MTGYVNLLLLRNLYDLDFKIREYDISLDSSMKMNNFKKYNKNQSNKYIKRLIKKMPKKIVKPRKKLIASNKL
jgi:hypothetical protein